MCECGEKLKITGFLDSALNYKVFSYVDGGYPFAFWWDTLRKIYSIWCHLLFICKIMHMRCVSLFACMGD